MTPGAGVLMLRRGHTSHYCQYIVFSTLSIYMYSTLITIVLMDYDSVFLYHYWFSFFLWWGCWYTNIQIKAPLIKSQCKVSDTQVTVMACEPLVKFCQCMLCAKFGWNWSCGFREEDFLILSMCFRYFVIISPWKRAEPFIWINLNPLHPKDVLIQVWFKLVQWFLRRRWNCEKFTDGRTDGRRMTGDQKS